MTPFLQLALLIAILLVATKLGGYLSILAGQPSVLGELLVGLLIGPSAIDLLHLPIFSDHLLPEFIEQLAEMGVLLLMFVAGLELHFSELARNMRVSALAGILGVVIPIGLGYMIGVAFGYPFELSLFLGLTLGATSVSISAQTLMELRALRSRVGLGLLGAAVFDDVLVILIFSAFLAILSGEAGLGTIITVFLRMLLFLLISVAFGWLVLPGLVRRVARLPISQGVLTLALVIMLLYGFAAEVLGGMAAITGAFLAGLMFARSPEKERLERGVTALAYGFFVPIFFVNIGLSVNARDLDASVAWLFFTITLAAIAGKFFGAGFGARLAQFSWRESFQLGAGMISRGEVGLILASVGAGQNVLSSGEFSAIVGMVLVTTLVTPPLLRALFSIGEPATAVHTPEPTVEEAKILDEEIT